MRKFAALLALLAVASVSFGAETTEAILKKATADAAQQHKNVLVMFHASWCGWCHKLDDFLTKTDAGKMVSKQFVVVHITVLENDAHKADENAGGEELLDKLGGKNQGIPYFAILDANGKSLITSNPNKDKPGNIGYPAAEAEIAHFMKMLKVGTKMTDKQLDQVKTSLTEIGKEINSGH